MMGVRRERHKQIQMMRLKSENQQQTSHRFVIQMFSNEIEMDD